MVDIQANELTEMKIFQMMASSGRSLDMALFASNVLMIVIAGSDGILPHRSFQTVISRSIFD
jgi:hypothetical protein